MVVAVMVVYLRLRTTSGHNHRRYSTKQSGRGMRRQIEVTVHLVWTLCGVGSNSGATIATAVAAVGAAVAVTTTEVAAVGVAGAMKVEPPLRVGRLVA